MTLGLMMVVRNEAHRIEECLKWHMPYVDEVAICDQQSDDGTWEKLQVFKQVSLVPFHIWQDKQHGHCAPSRKPTTDLLSTDWVINVDADEKFDILLLKQLNTLLEATPYDGFWVKRKNSFDVQVYDDSIAVQPHWLYVEHPVIEKQFRLYKREKAVFSNTLHGRANVGNNVAVLDYIIDHRKTLDEMWADLRRFKTIK